MGPAGPAGQLIGPAGGDLTDDYPNPQIRAGSILSTDIADGTITQSDLNVNSVSGEQIEDSTIRSIDIQSEEVHADDLGISSVGAPELGSIEVVQTISAPVNREFTARAEATCPPDTQLIGGGVDWDIKDRALFVGTNGPKPAGLQSPTTWEVAGLSQFNAPARIIAKAMCLRG